LGILRILDPVETSIAILGVPCDFIQYNTPEANQEYLQVPLFSVYPMN
jgi:hypothetical protein